MTTTEIKSILSKDIVSFRYTKNDHTTRHAHGTLNRTIISRNGGTPKGGTNPVKRAGYISYFDTDKNEWRCFKPSDFVLE